MKKARGSELESGKGCRQLAVEILLKVEQRKAYADILLDNALRKTSLSSPDRALLTELVYGTLRWRGRIDWHLERSLLRPLPDANPYLRNLLRLSLYQLLFLSKVPDYAAVSEGVELAKRRSGAAAGGLINAVLRKILREKDRLPYPDPQQEPLRYLSAFWSHPEWLVRRWLDSFGRQETELLLKANNQPSPLTLRVNRLREKREKLLQRFSANGFAAAASPWSPQGIQLQSAAAVDRLPGFQAGLFQVQGEASQMVAYLLDPKPGERILDACAAPGGKTTHIAELMEDKGEIVATDISARGLEKLKQNVRRLGLSSVSAFVADVSAGLTGALAVPYDRILVDAPCSGLGTLRSHPEAKWHRQERDIERLGRLQKKILDQLAPHLKPGGILLYATCTLTREENEQAIEGFLSRHGDFALENAESCLPRGARTLVCENYFLALPHRHNTDGFFAARMRKAAQVAG